MCGAGIGRKPAGHTAQYGYGGSREYSVGGCGRPSCAAVSVSPFDPVPVTSGGSRYAACLRLDSCAEDKQTDTFRSHQRYR